MVIRGARQVGKTWLMKEFGRTQYDDVAYINMDGNTQMKNLFELDYDIERIVNGLEIASGVKIQKGQTLIVLDEIQEVPKALTALKYFYENAPHYHIVVAGSLLGVALHQGTSFPVGKVNFMDLYPLSFIEFLQATNEGKYAALLTSEEPDFKQIKTFAPKIIDLLRTYYVVGGMPEVVEQYVKEGNLLTVRTTQETILAAYQQDFSKHAPVNIVPRLREIWDSIPSQLAKENKKFIFRQVRQGARGREYEAALLWIEDAGLATKVAKVNKPAIPLKSYEDSTNFKLFFLDVGLLGAKSGLDPTAVLDGDSVFEEFKGALTEQFVFQEMKVSGVKAYYFANNDSRGEIDFMITTSGNAVPIEVKAEKNVQSRSLNAFVAKYSAQRAVKVSMNEYSDNGVICHIPLYLAASIQELI